MSEPITVPITAEDLNAIRTGASVSLARQVLQLPIDGMLEALREIAAIDAPPGYSPAPAPQAAGEIEQFARQFHETYERLAPSFKYVTREETKAFDPQSANGKLMIAVCSEILRAQQQTIDAMREALALIANRGETEMKLARTLHYDMRGIAAAAIAATPESK